MADDDDAMEKCIQRVIDYHETSLNLSNRSLRAVPQSVSFCSSLRHLYLNNNELIIPPTEQLSQLIDLETLSLEFNSLTILPDTLWHLTSLIRLNLSHNPLGSLSVQLGQLRNLRELWVTNAQLYDLPTNVFIYLNHLEKFCLKSNRLRDLPSELGRLIQLRWFSIEDNELTDLPDSLQDCIHLSYLNMNGNRFVQIPFVIGKLSSLNIVCLQRNAIVNVDDESLLMLSNMTKVDLRENPLGEKPEHWKGLEFIKIGRCIDVALLDEEENSQSSNSSHNEDNCT